MSEVSYKTEQEAFWAGEFGDEYIGRNDSAELLASNLNFFSKALSATSKIHSCIEFGANIGMNLKALKLLYPSLDVHAIEINKKAANALGRVVQRSNIFDGSMLDYDSEDCFDLCLIKGVLIHVNPGNLADVYKKLVNATGRYLLIAEYYNPSPVSIEYRGNFNKLFKRDFAGDILEEYPDMHLADYGFCYRRDQKFPQDDITWFLLEKIRR